VKGVACTHDDRCITCGDIAVPLEVVALGRDGIAVCRDEQDGFEDVDVSLVEPLDEGDVVLVHARVALSRQEAA
jgi:hydrogenase maturation factor